LNTQSYRYLIPAFLVFLHLSFPALSFANLTCSENEVHQSSTEPSIENQDHDDSLHFLTRSGDKYSKVFFDDYPVNLVEYDSKKAAIQYALGNQYYHGRGVQKNDAEAARWYCLAAKQGHALAQNSLGNMYRYGEGVSPNYTEAVTWYLLAAAQDLPQAQNNLAYMFWHGLGVPQDMTEAMKLYRFAAEKNEKPFSEIHPG
jgi:hypothetical protein